MTAAFQAAYAPHHDMLPDLPDASGGLDQDIEAHSVWVAEMDGTLVGGIVLQIDGARARLANIAVAPGSAGQGVGRQLIAQAVSSARERGAETMELTTHVGLGGNVGLYRRLGWEERTRDGNKVHMIRTL